MRIATLSLAAMLIGGSLLAISSPAAADDLPEPVDEIPTQPSSHPECGTWAPPLSPVGEACHQSIQCVTDTLAWVAGGAGGVPPCTGFTCDPNTGNIVWDQSCKLANCALTGTSCPSPTVTPCASPAIGLEISADPIHANACVEQCPPTETGIVINGNPFCVPTGSGPSVGPCGPGQIGRVVNTGTGHTVPACVNDPNPAVPNGANRCGVGSPHPEQVGIWIDNPPSSTPPTFGPEDQAICIGFIVGGVTGTAWCTNMGEVALVVNNNVIIPCTDPTTAVGPCASPTPASGWEVGAVVLGNNLCFGMYYVEVAPSPPWCPPGALIGVRVHDPSGTPGTPSCF